MATFWKIDGFEHGLIGSGGDGIYDSVTGGVSAVTSPTRGHLRSLRVDTGGVASRIRYDFPASTRQAVASFALHFTTADGLPGANVTLAIFAQAGSSGPGIVRYMSASQRLQVSHNGVNGVLFGPTIALDTWYWVDLYYDSSATSCTLTARVDHGQAQTSSRNGTSGGSDSTSFSLGTVTNETYGAHFDDLVLSLTAADWPLGTHHIESLIPSSDGTHNITTTGDFDSFTTTAFSNSTTNGYSFLGHRPLQAANTTDQVIRQDLGTTSNYMEFLLENLGSTTGTAVAARVYAAHTESSGTGASLGEARLLLSDNTEVLTEGSLSVVDSTEDPGSSMQVHKRMALDPSGGWDNTKVNGLKVRVGFADGVPDVNFVDFMVEVALNDVVNATPSTIAAVADLATPTITMGAGPVPDTITGVADIPTPTPTADANANPSTIAGVAALPTPTIVAGGGVFATPATVTAQAALPTPTILTAPPSGDFYSYGYGQGYETIVPPEPPAPPVTPPAEIPTPDIRIRVDWETDINPVTGATPQPNWVDISDALRAGVGCSIQRGRQRQLDRNESGTATMMFRDDPDRLLDPDNTESPYWPNILPDRRMQVQAVFPWETDAFTMCSSFVGDDDIVGGGSTSKYITLWEGLTDEFIYTYPGQGRMSEVSVRGLDIMALMSRDPITTAVLGPYYLEDKLNEILNYRAYTGRAEGVFAGQATGNEATRNIFGSLTETLYAPDRVTVLEPKGWTNTAMMQAIDEAVVSGGGNFFISRDGKPTYRSLGWPAKTPVVLRMAVDEERYRDVEFTYDSSLIFNDVHVSNSTATAIVQDAASLKRHPGRAPLEVTTMLLDDVGTTLNTRAVELLAAYREPERIISHLIIRAADTDWESVLSLDLWDRVDVEVILPNGDTIEQPSIIQGIAINTSQRREWTVDWWLSRLPVTELLSDANRSFELGDAADWTAGSNCVVVATNQEYGLKLTGHRDHRYYVPAYWTPTGANGSWVLWADSVAAGSFSVVGPQIPIDASENYRFQVGVRTVRYDDTNIEYANYLTPGPWRLELDWLDGGEVLLSTDIGDDVTYTVTSPNFWNKWTQLLLERRAPGGAAFLQPRVVYRGSGPAGFFIDGASAIRTV